MAEVARPASARSARVVAILFALTLALLGPAYVAATASAPSTRATSWPERSPVAAGVHPAVRTNGPAAAEASSTRPDERLRVEAAGTMIATLLGLAVLVLRRQART